MGATFSIPHTEIATDTRVQKVIFGKRPGEDSTLDIVMKTAGVVGLFNLALRNRYDKNTQIASDVLSVGAIVFALQHFYVDYDIPVPASIVM
jgi:hypothetical protein